MTAIGIRNLKNRLSYYLGQVKKGRTIRVSERGREIALIVPTPNDPEEVTLWRLVRMGRASWSGGKPRGVLRRIKIKGPSVAQAVIEDRR